MLRMDTPALEKGGYTLGLAPIAFQYKGSARVLVIRPFDGSAEKKTTPVDQGPSRDPPLP